MTETPGTDRDQARENVREETPLVPEQVQGSEDDPLSTEHPTNRGDQGQDADSAKPPAGSTDLGT
jgi:hypothetical protein